MTLPKIIVIDDRNADQGCVRFRIWGGDITTEWAEGLRADDLAFCELTVGMGYKDAHNHLPPLVAGYGGTVGPLAWPTLFKLDGEATVFTEAGLEAFDAVHKLVRTG
jgi:hypothetical protein